jgi:Predicted glycosyl hydrolase
METYIVKNGDTLESIAAMYNVPVEDIVRVNNLMEPYYLYEGLILSVPTPTFNVFDYYTVKQGDTLFSIARRYGTDVDTLVSINGISKYDYIYPNQTLLVPKNTVVTYVTKQGDTLTKVSKYFGTTEVAVLNNNSNIYLQPEQLLIYRKI